MGLLVCAVVLGAGLYARWLERSEHEALLRADAATVAASLGASLSRELNSVLYLTSGVRSYLAVRYRDINSAELDAILANLYHSAEHVRNFGVAQGLRLTHVYPMKGNEKALGLYYPDVPRQWPEVKRVIESGVPQLIGPVALVQGGQGLVYRVPISVGGAYWGLVTTVIDTASLLDAAFAGGRSGEFDIALRGRHGLGLAGETFYGQDAVFERPDRVLVHTQVPGGEWVLGIAPRTPPRTAWEWLWYAGIAAVALALGASTLLILHQRAELSHQAVRDVLTGLPNRQLIEDRLQLALARQRRGPGLVFALLFLDLDGFKAVNDRHGHKVGDGVLRVMAERLARAVRETDLVGRWGGDEFAIVLDTCDAESIRESTERLRRAVELSVEVDGLLCLVGASIGVAVIPDDGPTVAALLRVADERMYADKAARKGSAAAAV